MGNIAEENANDDENGNKLFNDNEVPYFPSLFKDEVNFADDDIMPRACAQNVGPDDLISLGKSYW